MALESIAQTIVTFVREHEGWAVPVIFLVAFGESFCFLSLAWPGWLILLSLAGLLAASGIQAEILVPAIISAGLGGTLGYAVSYWIGLYFKDSIGKVWPFSRSPDLLDTGKRFFDRYGTMAVFFGHFVGPVRAVIPVVAGMFAMPQLPFQIANAVSAFIWAAGAIVPAFYAVSFKDEIVSFVGANAPVVAALMFAFAIANSIARPILFLPTLVLFIALGAIHAFAGGEISVIWLAGALGAFVGDVFAYFLGNKHKADINGAWPLAVSQRQHASAQKTIERWGAASLILSKLQGFNRGLVPLESGALERPYGAFVTASVVSSLMWSAVFLLPAHIVRYFSG